MKATDGGLDIGEVVHRSGVPVSTLHVWEKHGLITPSGRRGLRRQYDREVLERIATIVLFQRGGFTLSEISGLVAPDSFARGKHRLAQKLEELRQRRLELDAAITGLEHAVECPEPSPLACSIFQTMLNEVLPVKRD